MSKVGKKLIAAMKEAVSIAKGETAPARITVKDLTHEITTDSKTVWVNDSQGCCIGRFSKNGIDVHHNIKTQMENSISCLDCKPGPTTIDDWRHFQTAMLAHYKIVIDDKYMPFFLKP